jgi:hypothetical protein
MKIRDPEHLPQKILCYYSCKFPLFFIPRPTGVSDMKTFVTLYPSRGTLFSGSRNLGQGLHTKKNCKLKCNVYY